MASSKKSSLEKTSKLEKKVLHVTKEEFFSLKPIQSTFLTVLKEKEDGLLLEVNIAQFKKKSIRRRLIPSPNYRKIQLDKLGKFTFELCNGNNTVKQIIRKFQETFKLTLTETETAVAKYLTLLNTRHLIGWQIPQDMIEGTDSKDKKVDEISLD
ncbi:hypothetical protein CEE45_04135 [Candidatus Heimdallarchaeota archaeon B3_Heim]|nr:MAG: hypothetical protein CEE45_04135 [Candidatus Heimdallarchaeota archaeon B3_Heim]